MSAEPDYAQLAFNALNGVVCDPTDLTTACEAIDRVTAALVKQLGRSLTREDYAKRNGAVMAEWNRRAARGVGSAERREVKAYQKAER